MPTQEEIYKTEGDKYEALIAREDYQGNIMRALREIISLEDCVVYDLGAGTGRLACLLAPHVKHVRAFDISEEMLRVCRKKFIASGLANWQVDVADHRQLPVDDASADLVVSGWSVAYLAVWNPESWRSELEKWTGYETEWNHRSVRVAWHRERIANSTGTSKGLLSLAG
jgi:SAM-dependent methyltransferase